MFGRDHVFNPNKVAVYIRWSTDEQGQGTTLEVQQEACEHYCKSQGWTFRPDLVFVDDGYSGGTLDRPALTALREAVRSGLVECVVVYKLDRLSRNLLDCVTLVRQEWSERCALFSTKENFDTKSPVGQMVFNILVSFAEFERNIIRDRTLSGKRKRASQGRNAGQRYPFGYRKGDNGEWALDGWDDEQQCFTAAAAIVRRVFTEFLSGVGTTTIADKLRKEQIPAPMGGEWRFGAISRMLGNPMYSGQYEYGKRSPKGRKAHAPIYSVSGTIPPIVSPQEFERVQRLRQERQDIAPRSLASEYLLSGLARCAKCGAPVNGSMGDGKKRYYVCTGRIILRNCDCAYIDAEKLEDAFLEEMKRTYTLDNIRHHIEVMEAQARQRIEECTHAVRRAEEAAEEAARKQKRLDDEFFSGKLSGQSYDRLSESVQAESTQAREKLQRSKADLASAEAVTIDVDFYLGVAKTADAWRALEVQELKQLLRELVGTLTVYQAKALNRSKKGNQNPLQIDWRPKLNLMDRLVKEA